MEALRVPDVIVKTPSIAVFAPRVLVPAWLMVTLLNASLLLMVPPVMSKVIVPVPSVKVPAPVSVQDLAVMP